jgi:hypothetical protein
VRVLAVDHAFGEWQLNVHDVSIVVSHSEPLMLKHHATADVLTVDGEERLEPYWSAFGPLRRH